MKRIYRLSDYSSNRCVDTPWTGSHDDTLHELEDWDGGLHVTVYMEGVNFFSEIFLDKRMFCDTIVESVATGKLYYTKKSYLSENLEKISFSSDLAWSRIDNWWY